MSSSDSENESDTKKKERKKKIQVRGKEVREKNSGGPKIFLAKISTRQNQKEECRYK